MYPYQPYRGKDSHTLLDKYRHFCVKSDVIMLNICHISAYLGTLQYEHLDLVLNDVQEKEHNIIIVIRAFHVHRLRVSDILSWARKELFC